MAKPKTWIRYLPVGIGIVLSLLVGFGVWKLQGWFEKPIQAKKQIQQITVVQPPPPPPPPEQKPPEPEVKEEKIEQPEPEPEPEPEQAQDEPAPQEDLGLDAEGQAGADGFGLQGRKGGRGLLGGGGGNAIVWYGQQLSKKLETEVQNRLDSEARAKRFSAIVALWVDADGRISRAELASGSGDAPLDASLRQLLASFTARLDRPPPPTMPQPVKVRIRG